MIPKRIIHIFVQPDRDRPLPMLCQACAANARLLNPDFEYCFFDDKRMASFLENEFPEYVDVFQSFPYPIQRYDFFRYLAVYRLGGFYFDLDVFLTQGLDPLLGHQAVFSYEDLTFNSYLSDQHQVYFEIGNYGFGCRTEHPFMKAIIENCVRGRRDPVWERRFLEGLPWVLRSQWYVPSSTGPGLVTRTWAENPALRPTVELLFPSELSERARWRYFGDYGVHVTAGSWQRRENALRRFLGRQLIKRLRRKLAPAWASVPARADVSAVAARS
jgi:mannosyltransferase OCH1-like enzyme